MVLSSILRSILILLIFSSIIGIGLHPFIGFLSGSMIGLSLQVIGWLFWDQFILAKERARAKWAEAEAIKSLESQLVSVVCPCTRCEDIVCPLRLDRQNVVKCEACGNDVGVDINISTYLKTNPINNDMARMSLEHQFDQAQKMFNATQPNSIPTTTDDLSFLR